MKTETVTNKYLLEVFIAQVSVHSESDCLQPQ